MALQIEPSQAEFEGFLDRQLGLVGLHVDGLAHDLPGIYSRIAEQFSRVRNKYYRCDGAPTLRLGHNAQYSIFLYHLSRSQFAAGDRLAADKLYALLRMVSSFDLYYEVSLPRLWACDHPLGSVIGRARFAEAATFFFVQNCTIGNNNGIYPDILGNLHMLPNSNLLGATKVVGNVVLANGACAIDAGELRDCMVFGRSPGLTIKPLAEGRFLDLSAFQRVP